MIRLLTLTAYLLFLVAIGHVAAGFIAGYSAGRPPEGAAALPLPVWQAAKPWPGDPPPKATHRPAGLPP